MLLKWLQKPHIKAWWDDGDDSLEEVRRHYLDQPENEQQAGSYPGVQRFIVYHAGAFEFMPVGYAQYFSDEDYPGETAAVGIDLFLADAQQLNRGLGTMILTEFVNLIMANEVVGVITADPEAANARAIRCCEKVGFRYHRTVETEAGKTHHMMVLNKNKQTSN